MVAHLIADHRKHKLALARKALFHGLLQLVLEPQRHVHIDPILKLHCLVSVLVSEYLDILEVSLYVSHSRLMLLNLQLAGLDLAILLDDFVVFLHHLLRHLGYVCNLSLALDHSHREQLCVLSDVINPLVKAYLLLDALLHRFLRYSSHVLQGLLDYLFEIL